MTEYYRVRSQKQWDWLMKYFEKVDKGIRWDYSGEKPTEYNNWKKFKSNSYIALLGDVTLFYGDVERDELSDFIEVSNLMEDEKMKAEGEPMTEIVLDDIYQVNHGVRFENGKKIKFVTLPTSKLYPKVRMSVAEKKEFDRLKENALSLRFAFDELKSEHGNYPKLCERLFNNTLDVEDSKAQNDFARAWADPSLIEVIPEKKWNVKIPPFSRTNNYYFKVGKNLESAASEYNGDEDQQFTADELKEYGLDDDMYEKVEVKE